MHSDIKGGDHKITRRLPITCGDLFNPHYSLPFVNMCSQLYVAFYKNIFVDIVGYRIKWKDSLLQYSELFDSTS